MITKTKEVKMNNKENKKFSEFPVLNRTENKRGIEFTRVLDDGNGTVIVEAQMSSSNTSNISAQDIIDSC
jgi:hypothetical protein